MNRNLIIKLVFSFLLGMALYGALAVTTTYAAIIIGGLWYGVF